MAKYSITSLGGVVTKDTLDKVWGKERSPSYKWVGRLRTALDFITPENTLVCLADNYFFDSITEVKPIGLTQSFSWNENPSAALVPEIGSRRKRAMVGSSQGGSIQIGSMTVIGKNLLYEMTEYGITSGKDKSFWGEEEWLSMVGVNHDKLKTPMGLVVVEATPDGRNYSAYMFEQCLVQGQSRALQAGQHLVAENFNLIFEQVVPIHSFEKLPTTGDVGGEAVTVDYVTSI